MLRVAAARGGGVEAKTSTFGPRNRKRNMDGGVSFPGAASASVEKHRNVFLAIKLHGRKGEPNGSGFACGGGSLLDFIIPLNGANILQENTKLISGKYIYIPCLLQKSLKVNNKVLGRIYQDVKSEGAQVVAKNFAQ